MKTRYIVPLTGKNNESFHVEIDAIDAFAAQESVGAKYQNYVVGTAVNATRHNVVKIVSSLILAAAQDAKVVRLPKGITTPLATVFADVDKLVRDGEVPTLKDLYQVALHFFGAGSGPGGKPH